MERDLVGRSLFAAQLVALAGLAWPGRRRWPLPRPVSAAALALAVGGAGLSAAGVGQLGTALSPFPAPPADAPLRTDGPYSIVRHPIYTGLLVGGAGVAALRARPEPLFAFAALSVVLHVKARYEERLLRARFGAAYADYAARVPRLVPRLTRRPA